MHNNGSSSVSRSKRGSGQTGEAAVGATDRPYDLSAPDEFFVEGLVPPQGKKESFDGSVLVRGVTDRRVPGTRTVPNAGPALDGVLRKCEWLDSMVDAAHSMLHQHHAQRKELLWNEGADVGYVIDWRSVVNYCQPDVLVVLYRDPTRLKIFDDFPKFAIIPSLRECVDLQKENWLGDIQARVINKQDDETSTALNVLQYAASKLEPAKKGNAMSVLATAKRLLLPSK